jgi:hypothetical protein
MSIARRNGAGKKNLNVRPTGKKTAIKKPLKVRAFRGLTVYEADIFALKSI